MSNTSKRLNYIDMAKGIGMVLVLIGHLQGDPMYTYSPYIYPLCVYIFSFHMPMFFIISGILIAIKKEDLKPFKETAKKRFRSIMIPYFWFSFFYLLTVVYALIKGGVMYQTLLINLWYVVSGYGMNVLWFLPALYLGELLFIFLKRKLRDHKIFLAIVILSNAIVYVVADLMCKGVYETALLQRLHELATALLRPVLVMGFITIGYYVHLAVNKNPRIRDFFNKPSLNEKGKITAKHRSAYIVLSLMLFTVCFCFFRINNGIDFRSMNFRNIFFFFICALSASFGLLVLCMALPKIRLLCFWGIGSLIFMATHNSQTILALSIRTAMYINQYLTRARGYICYAIILLIMLTYTSLMILIIQKFFPFLTGKPFKKIKK